MDIVTLSRLQFATTSIYHFFFVPLTMGLALLLAIMETFYVASGKEVYRRMAKFWGKLFVINFAMGVVTGIVQEFHFGMNWSEYSRFVGDIFGAPLAFEALTAFFLEASFLGLWIFGWNRLKKGVHLTAIWLVALGSNLSGFWILIANSFMQDPVGYQIENGRAVMTDFWALVSNPHVLLQAPHTLMAALCTASFFVMGIAAYQLLRQKENDLFQRSFKMGAVAGLIAIALVIFMGDMQGKYLGKHQPMKVAAMELLWETSNPADFAVVAIGDEQAQKNTFELRIPSVLSFLMYNRFTGEVRGIKNLQTFYEKEYGPGNYVPPTNLLFWAFRFMVGFGFLLLFTALYFLFFIMRKKPVEKIPLLKVMPFLIALPFLSNAFGWIVAELGRQPWVVYGLMKTSDAVSPNLAPGMVLASEIGFLLVYAILMAADIYLLAKTAKTGPEPELQLSQD